VGICEKNSAGGEAVEVRRLNARPSAEAIHPIVQVVDGDEKDVGSFRLRRTAGQPSRDSHGRRPRAQGFDDLPSRPGSCFQSDPSDDKWIDPKIGFSFFFSAVNRRSRRWISFLNDEGKEMYRYVAVMSSGPKNGLEEQAGTRNATAPAVRFRVFQARLRH
jgi:hypothetical protein